MADPTPVTTTPAPVPAAPQVPDLAPYVKDVHNAIGALNDAGQNPDAAVGAIQPIVNILNDAWAALKGMYDKANAGTPDDPSKT